MIKIPLQKACALLDEAWYVSEACGKDHKFSHHSFGCSGDPDTNFLDFFEGKGLMRFIEKDNQEVEISGQEMILVNEAGAKMALVLFMKPSWLEGAWADAVRE